MWKFQLISRFHRTDGPLVRQPIICWGCNTRCGLVGSWTDWAVELVKDVRITHVVNYFNGSIHYWNRHFIFRIIAILLEEVKSNVLKLHISQNNPEKHGFTVNINQNYGGSRHQLIFALLLLLLNWHLHVHVHVFCEVYHFKVSVFLSKTNMNVQWKQHFPEIAS